MYLKKTLNNPDLFSKKCFFIFANYVKHAINHVQLSSNDLFYSVLLFVPSF